MVWIFKYLWSLTRHKWFVFLEACRLGIPILGFFHDFSKFSPVEFFSYAKNFYGGGDKEAFDLGWLHHQHRNKHHWQRWVLTRETPDGDEPKVEALHIPLRYRKEMIADWKGAGKAYGNPDTKGWYLRTREKMILHPLTREWIEKELGVTDEEIS